METYKKQESGMMDGKEVGLFTPDNKFFDIKNNTLLLQVKRESFDLDKIKK